MKFQLLTLQEPPKYPILFLVSGIPPAEGSVIKEAFQAVPECHLNWVTTGQDEKPCDTSGNITLITPRSPGDSAEYIEKSTYWITIRGQENLPLSGETTFETPEELISILKRILTPRL